MTGPERRIWIDGRFVAWDDATVHVLSHSLQRGSLVFDYLSVYATERGPALFRLPEHLARFFDSVAIVGLEVSWSAEALHRACLETVAANPGATAVKICAYLPSIEVDVVPMDPRVEVAIAAYDVEADVVARKAHPVHKPATARLKLERQRRRIEAHLPPHAKAAANYLGPMMAKWKARREGYDEVAMLDERGYLAEGPTTNLFLVDDGGTLLTPSLEAVLPGITRSTVFELAKHLGVEVVEKRLDPEAIFAAVEVFLCGTSARLWPVASVDGRAVGAAPGPVTERLAQRLELATSGRDAAFEHWLTFVDAHTPARATTSD